MNRYQRSTDFLETASQFIPLGSQTFSKSRTQYPPGVSPLFIQKAKGSKVWDIDGNEYTDFVSGLLAISIGYANEDIDNAVMKQMQNGVTFSLPHPIETQVAEKLCDIIPSAEMVRFGKNGSDATSGAIRLARAYTKRDRIAVCGYHGWQDWYIGTTTKNLGVPEVVRKLTHTFVYNDIGSLQKLLNEHPGEFAAIIMEPMNVFYPKDSFLEKVKELTHQHGALLIFDETITGFRLAPGGAQELFGVTPDLSTFGKGMANGYPLSAVVGKREIMQLMEEIFFSTTFGGETLSLAATLAVIEKIEKENILEKIHKTGETVASRVQAIVDKHKLNDVVSITGHPSWSFCLFADTKDYDAFTIKTLYLQEAFAAGILIIASHNISAAHTEDDVNRLVLFYESFLEKLSACLKNKNLVEQLKCDPLRPLFKVR